MKPRHVKISAIFGAFSLSIGLAASKIASRYASGEHPNISAATFETVDAAAQVLFGVGIFVLFFGVAYPILVTIMFPIMARLSKVDPIILRRRLFFRVFFISERNV